MELVFSNGSQLVGYIGCTRPVINGAKSFGYLLSGIRLKDVGLFSLLLIAFTGGSDILLAITASSFCSGVCGRFIFVFSTSLLSRRHSLEDTRPGQTPNNYIYWNWDHRY